MPGVSENHQRGVRPLIRPLSDETPRLRLRGVTVAVTLICAGIGVIYLVLFSAFGRPDVGAVVGGLMAVPIPVLAWRRYFRQRARLEELGVRSVGEKGRG